MEAHALRANIPKAAFTPCRQVRNGDWHTRVNSFLPFTFSFFLVYSSLLIYIGFVVKKGRGVQRGRARGADKSLETAPPS
jgi:hypothetical protein